MTVRGGRGDCLETEAAVFPLERVTVMTCQRALLSLQGRVEQTGKKHLPVNHSVLKPDYIFQLLH